MLPSLVIGFLLLPQYLSTVGRYDGPLKSLFYHTNACETQVYHVNLYFTLLSPVYFCVHCFCNCHISIIKSIMM